MKKMAFLILFFAFSSAFASVDPGYTLAPISSITGGAVDGGGATVSFSVGYSYQPCAQKVVKMIKTEVPAGVPSKKALAIGVLLYDSGFQCAGPTVLKSETVIVRGPFPSGGVVAFPIK